MSVVRFLNAIINPVRRGFYTTVKISFLIQLLPPFPKQRSPRNNDSVGLNLFSRSDGSSPSADVSIQKKNRENRSF